MKSVRVGRSRDDGEDGSIERSDVDGRDEVGPDQDGIHRVDERNNVRRRDSRLEQVRQDYGRTWFEKKNKAVPSDPLAQVHRTRKSCQRTLEDEQGVVL